MALESYYEEHPIDSSYEGILAARMGVTTEYLAEVLDLTEGLIWLANYDPSEMYPYKVEEKEDGRIAIKDDKITMVDSYIVNNKPFGQSTRRDYLIAQ